MSPALLVVAALAATPQAELIDFSATWCEPCQQMKPIVEKLHREGYPVREVDVDQQRALANRYNVTALPTFILVVNDKEVARLVARPEAELRQMLKLIPEEASSQSKAPPEEPKKKRRWLPDFLSGDDDETAEATSPFPAEAVARGQSPDQPQTPEGPVAPMAAQDPLQTSVRIRVKDARGIDYGSGTVIGSKDGQALILTCWHIFRGASPEDTIQVDVFLDGSEGKPQTFPGQFITGNEKADVALVGITGCDMMPVSPIAATPQFPKPDDIVFSVGCGEGRPQPTKLQHRVTRLNPFTGPDTTECTGEPVVGRSGGGLFNAGGRVIGVCFAAEKDKVNPRGVYVGPSEIHAILEEAGFAALIPSSEETILAETAGSEQGQEISKTEAAPETDNVFASLDSPSQLGAATTDLPVETAATPPESGGQDRPAITPMDSGRAASILAGLSGGEIEATVVLRRRDRPGVPSQVIVINQVSDRFRRYLTGEVNTQPMETSLRTRTSDPHDVARLAVIFNNRR